MAWRGRPNQPVGTLAGRAALRAPMHPVAAALAPLTVLDPAAQPAVVGTLWADRPRVLIWLRHFG